MKFYKSLTAIAILHLFFQEVFAQDYNLHKVSEAKLREHVIFLASDNMHGREIGSTELKLTAEYLQNNLKKMKLTSPEGSLLQHFTLHSIQPDEQNSFLKVLNKKGKTKRNITNFIALNQSSPVVDIEGELVFAGFGLGIQILKGNDLAETEVKGMIVLYSSGTPQSISADSAHSWNISKERKKMEKLFDAGAKAIIVVTSVQDTANSAYQHLQHLSSRPKFSLTVPRHKENPKIFIISPETADELTGKKINWSNTLKNISENKSPASFSIKNNKIHIRSVLKESMVDATNVFGIVEGRDSLLKNECILFMAHYDHLGTGKNGEIFNGADDNASGVATLLEVAGLFSVVEEKPRRSVLFLFPSAEEAGLFGSDYYTGNPVFPIKNTIACINLDMVGRVYEERDSVVKNTHKKVKDFDGIYTLVNDFNPNLKNITADACSLIGMSPDFSLPRQFFYTSDHYHFHKFKIPVLNLSTGYTADYHKPSDKAEKIRTDKMERIARLCFLVGMELGNQE